MSESSVQISAVNGLVSLKGTVVKRDDTAIVFQYKKPRSSKVVQQTFPIGTVAMVYPHKDETILVAMAPIGDTILSVKGSVKTEKGTMTVSYDEGKAEIITPALLDVQIVAEADAEKASKKPAKKAVKAAKEEKPAKGGKKPAKGGKAEKPAKKKKKG